MTRIRRRWRIREIPDQGFLDLLAGPRNGSRGGLGTVITVKPHKDRWEWVVELRFNGRHSLCGYSEGRTWRHPGPHEVHGRCKDQDEAWRRARLVVDDVRQRYAGDVVDIMRTQSANVPL